MPFFALSILFISACMHATWNYLAKHSQGGNLFVFMYMLVSFIWLSPIALFVISKESISLTGTALLFVLGSIVLHIVYSLSLQFGYKIGDLSLMYPIARGTGPFIVAIAAWFIYGEALTWFSITGILLIVCSIFILSGGLEIFRKKDINTTVFYGGYVGLIIASYTLVDKGAMTVVKLSPILFYYLVTAGQFLVLLPYAWKNRKHLKGEWHASKFHAIGVGVLNPLAYISVLIVMTFIPVSHVAPVREMSILIGTIMGTKLLSETSGFTRPIGAVLMVIGVIIVALN